MNFATNAIIVFTKNPEVGKVKTRLASVIGDEQAFAVYLHLLEQVSLSVRDTRLPVFVFYSEEIPSTDHWSSFACSRQVQQGNDLGIKMMNAFIQVFADGYSSACIIGCDTLDIMPSYLLNAFSALKDRDVVIGPTYDGGYLLLGLKVVYSELFLNMKWSHPTVFHETIRRMNLLNLDYFVTETLRDIDEFEDLRYYPQFQQFIPKEKQ